MSAAERDESTAPGAPGPAGSDAARVQSLRELLDRFDTAGVHFQESRRQALLGVREVLLVLDELVNAYGAQVPALKNLGAALLLGRGAVDFLIGRIEPLSDPEQSREIRIEALAILKDLLVAELMRSDDDESRREGLLTVIGVIDDQIERLATEQPHAPADAEPRDLHWIEVET